MIIQLLNHANLLFVKKEIVTQKLEPELLWIASSRTIELSTEAGLLSLTTVPEAIGIKI
jgi:hypothetical protein